MIQELFCGGGGEGGLLMEENKLPTKTTTTTTPSPSSTTTTTSTTNHPPNSHTTTTTSTATSEPQQQNLRCPRCDSSNTKFCYYNNYNLTQPRHFCKTCRRYWTKGGALRNVPIGGGCRKAKPSPTPLSSKFPPAHNKPRTPPTAMATPLVESTVLAKLNALRGVPFHPDLNHWPSHTSNLMALLASTRNSTHVASLLPLPNPNPNPNPNRIIKLEEGALMAPSYLVPDSTTTTAISSDPQQQQQLLNDPFSSMWKNSSAGEYPQLLQQQQQQGLVPGEPSINSGIHDLYQKLRWNSDSQNGVENLGSSPIPAASLGVCSSATTSSAAVGSDLLEPIPISSGAGGGDHLGGCWNSSPLPWSDHMPPSNGAFAAFP